MQIKLTEEQKERLIQNMNRLKEVTNEVKDNAPITYENMINLTFVEYFFADLFNLQLPKYKDCQHEDTCRSYYLEQKKDEIQDWNFWKQILYFCKKYLW